MCWLMCRRSANSALFPYTTLFRSIDRIFAPQLAGLSLLERETMHARMHRTVGNPAAKAAVDMAVWDALGRTLDTGVTELLGGYRSEEHTSELQSREKLVCRLLLEK